MARPPMTNAERLRTFRRSHPGRQTGYMHRYWAGNIILYRDRQRHIRRRRQANGLSQAALAEVLGVSKTTIYYWETGRVPANWDKLEAVFPGIKKEAYHKC